MASNVSKSSARTVDSTPLAVRTESSGEVPVDRSPVAEFSVALLLRKFAEVSLLASFIGAVIAYQLQIPESWTAALREKAFVLNGGSEPLGPSANILAGFLWDLRFGLAASMPILQLKSTVWLLTGVLAVIGLLMGRTYEKATGEVVFPTDIATPRKGVNLFRLIPLSSVVLFLLWSFLSISPIGWGTPPDPMAVTSEGSPMTTLAGSYQSYTAFFQLAAALVLFLVAEDLMRTRALVYKTIGMILGLGVFASVVSILVQARVPPLATIWTRWGPQEYRNDVGGIIGHNTAVSSFLMAPVLLSVAMLLLARNDKSPWRRIALMACVGVMGVTLLIAQSRAVIPILGVAVVVLLAMLARRVALKLTSGQWAAIAVMAMVGLLSQFVDHPANPLYRRNIPLSTRFEHLTVEHLHTETRLRILATSMPGILEHPVRGFGWASFQYAYPEVQGRYYVEHPESSLGPTAKRSMHAHNEYLQTLFETGVVGLVIALTGLIAILLGGRRALERSFRQNHIALQCAVIVALGALLAHAFLDFPLRVAPLAATLVMLLAIWSAGDRLWLVPVPSMDHRATERRPDDARDTNETSRMLDEEEEARMRARMPAPRPPARSPLAVGAWIASCFVSLGVATALGCVASHWFAAEVMNVRVNQYIGQYLAEKWDDPRRALAFLTGARKDAETGRRLAPLHGELMYQSAQLQQYAATEIFKLKVDAERKGDAKEAQTLSGVMNKALEGGMFLLDQSLGEYRFHGTFRVRAMFYYLRWMNRTDTERSAAQAIENMNRAVDMNPGDPETIMILAEWIERLKPSARERQTELHRLLLHFHRQFFHDRILSEVTIALGMFELDAARSRMATLIQADPDDRAMQLAMATASLNARDKTVAAEWIKRIGEWNPDLAQVGGAVIAAQNGDTSRALREIALPVQSLDATGLQMRAVLSDLMEARAAGQRGDSTGEADALDRIRERGRTNARCLVDAAMYSWILYRRHDWGRDFIQRRLAMTTEPDTPDIHAVAARLYMLAHEEELAALQRAQAEASAAGREIPVAPQGQMRADLREALEQYFKIRDLPGGNKTIDRIVATRTREIEAALGARKTGNGSE